MRISLVLLAVLFVLVTLLIPMAHGFAHMAHALGGG